MAEADGSGPRAPPLADVQQDLPMFLLALDHRSWHCSLKFLDINKPFRSSAQVLGMAMYGLGSSHRADHSLVTTFS